jgi:hypothetical protein
MAMPKQAPKGTPVDVSTKTGKGHGKTGSAFGRGK